jgi:glycosyltransferase involved in cell wall biosynthesis
VAKKHGLDLFFIYHDDSLFNRYGYKSILTTRHILSIFSYTKCVFAVSEQMVELLKKNGAKKVELLYPIPNGVFPDIAKPVWRTKFSEEINLAFGGLLFDDLHTEILIKTATALNFLSSNLILFTSSGSGLAKELRQKFDNVFFYPSVSVIILFSEFTKNASALLVFYSFKKDAEHRMFSSFPSKFLEYMAVGLPILIIAPEESTLGIWAKKNNWPLYVSDDKEELIISSLVKLKDEKFWNYCKSRCEEMSATVFNPQVIHEVLNEGLFLS